MKKVFLAAAVASMAFGGAASAAEPLRASQAVPAAAKVSAEAPVSRASKRSEQKSEIGGSAVLIAVLAAAAVIAGIVVATDGDDSNG
ncbi:hypothetical protein [Qipengyuania gaetbuli]|nr:hypothetical protein [Qipengyuania gaetbuli]